MDFDNGWITNQKSANTFKPTKNTFKPIKITMWSKWIFTTVILAIVLVQLINAANQQQRRQPQRSRQVAARRAANARARQVHRAPVHAAHRAPVRRAPVAARKAPARPASHPVRQTPSKQQNRRRPAPKQAAKRKAPSARRDEDGGADGKQFTNNGPYFSLPVVLGSQKAKVNVGVEGVYGASVIYGPKVLCSGCPSHATFDREASTSFKVEVSNKNFSFSLGTAIADAGDDYMAVGSMELNPTMFAVATKIPNHLHYKTKNSGHIAMWGPEDDEPMKTTMQKLVELNDNKIVTFYAPVDQNGMHAITFGREDTTHCKSNWATFDNVPVVVDNPDDKDKSPWIMNMNCVRWGSYVQHGTTRGRLERRIQLLRCSTP
ncbi:hypothetical protein M3Y97_01049200 [Aphelenchoides bicaudatus]|nr:hypothetical protein M3Y97_01049200 [Aphelenchoides bicaudatus]